MEAVRELFEETREARILKARDIIDHVGYQLNFLSCAAQDPSFGFTVIAIREYLEKAKTSLDEAMKE